MSGPYRHVEKRKVVIVVSFTGSPPPPPAPRPMPGTLEDLRRDLRNRTGR